MIKVGGSKSSAGKGVAAADELLQALARAIKTKPPKTGIGRKIDKKVGGALDKALFKKDMYGHKKMRKYTPYAGAAMLALPATHTMYQAGKIVPRRVRKGRWSDPGSIAGKVMKRIRKKKTMGQKARDMFRGQGRGVITKLRDD